jgi:hypothetical protein
VKVSELGGVHEAKEVAHVLVTARRQHKLVNDAEDLCFTLDIRDHVVCTPCPATLSKHTCTRLTVYHYP